MKDMKKLLLCCIISVLLIMVSIFGTMAFLSDSTSDVNTFSFGQVVIRLDEAKVNPDGTPVPGASRVLENTYHLLPGITYAKDPTVTVASGSLESYIRIILTVHNASAVQNLIAGAGLTDFSDLINGWDEDVWLYEGFTQDIDANLISFEFRYKEPVSAGTEEIALPALFESITVPGGATTEDMKALQAGGFRMVLTGHAIQTTGFDNADDAWEYFQLQA